MPTGRSRSATVVMPPAIRYRRAITSRVQKIMSSKPKMREWLEDLLDTDSCPGLQWKDRMEKIFTIEWRHASSQGFNDSEHGSVFLKWAQHQNRDTTNHSTNKSNFRCALHSLKDCQELTVGDEKRGEHARRTFQFVDLDTEKRSRGKRPVATTKPKSKRAPRQKRETSRKRRRLSEDSCSSGNNDDVSSGSISADGVSDMSTFPGDQDFLESETEALGFSRVQDNPAVSFNFNSNVPETVTQANISVLRQPVLTLKTETTPDGTTMIILPDPSDNMVQQAQDNQWEGRLYTLPVAQQGHQEVDCQSTIINEASLSSPTQGTVTSSKNLPNFAALGVPEHCVLEPLSYPKLSCGGQVKVCKPKELKIPSQLPQFIIAPPEGKRSTLFDQTAAGLRTESQVDLKSDPMPAPQEDLQPLADLDIGMSMEVSDQREECSSYENCHVGNTSASSDTTVSAVYTQACTTLLTSNDPMFGNQPHIPVVVEALYPNQESPEIAQLPSEIFQDIFSMEDTM